MVVVPWDCRESVQNAAQEQNLFLDERYGYGLTCLYCGELLDDVVKNREHTPSKTLLDKDLPYPPNLPTVPACQECNGGFSKDEQFVAALVECWRCGTTDPEGVERRAIGRALARSPGLLAGVAEVLASAGGVFGNARFWNVVDKLARAHVYYELNRSPLRVEPSANLLHAISEEERTLFEEPPRSTIEPYPEIGSRAFIDAATFMGFPVWWEIQEDRYRYMVLDGEPCEVRIVLSEFVAVHAKCWLDDLDESEGVMWPNEDHTTRNQG